MSFFFFFWWKDTRFFDSQVGVCITCECVLYVGNYGNMLAKRRKKTCVQCENPIGLGQGPLRPKKISFQNQVWQTLLTKGGMGAQIGSLDWSSVFFVCNLPPTRKILDPRLENQTRWHYFFLNQCVPFREANSAWWLLAPSTGGLQCEEKNLRGGGRTWWKLLRLPSWRKTVRMATFSCVLKSLSSSNFFLSNSALKYKAYSRRAFLCGSVRRRTGFFPPLSLFYFVFGFFLLSLHINCSYFLLLQWINRSKRKWTATLNHKVTDTWMWSTCQL